MRYAATQRKTLDEMAVSLCFGLTVESTCHLKTHMIIIHVKNPQWLLELASLPLWYASQA